MTDDHLIMKLYDHLPDGIVWYLPIFSNDKKLVDFKVAYCNKALGRNLKIPPESVIGEVISKTRYADSKNVVQIFNQCNQVYETGQPYDVSYYSPLYEEFFHVTRIKVMDGVLNIIRTRTREWKLELEKQQQAALITQIIDASPTCIVLCQAIFEQETVTDFTILSVNEKIAKDLKRPKSEIEGITYGALHPAVRTNGYLDMLAHVVTSGQPYRGEMYLEVFGGWFFVSADKVDEDKVVVICLDINDSKASAVERERLAGQLQSILNSSLNGVCSLRVARNSSGEITDFIYEKVNRKFEELTGNKAIDVEGKSYSSFYPHSREVGFFKEMSQVVETGRPKTMEIEYNADGLKGWFESSMSPMGSDGIVVSFDDITERKNAQIQLEKQKNLLNNILRHSPAAISITRMLKNEEGKVIDGQTTLINGIAEKFTGIPNEVSLSKKASEIVSGITESELFKRAVETLTTGKPSSLQYYLEPTQKWLELSVSKLNDDNLINVFTDITASKQAELSIVRSADNLKKVMNSAQVGMFTFKPVYDRNNDIIDFRFVIVNAAVAAYVKKQPEELIDGLGSTFFPHYKETGVFDMYKESYETGNTVRKEVYYNVDGHDNYLDIQSIRLDDVVLVTFTDHTPIRKVQMQLERLVEELKRSNANLEEFAYVASHDLKEPIRKINFFTDRLLKEYGHLLDDNGKQLFDRLAGSTDRMRTLIEDLLSYSQVTVRPAVFERVDLSMLMRMVLNDLELEVDEKDAAVNIDTLPIVQGHVRQLQQLFVNLIGNALKYSKPNIKPVITIRCKKIKGHEAAIAVPVDCKDKDYYLLQVEDNGIGFEQKYAEKIFQVFQRLHGNAEYRGTGVGLSIAKKVIENHRGYIYAQGVPGVGSKFNILFPG